MSLSFGIFEKKFLKYRRKFAGIWEKSSISPREKTIIIHRKDYEMILKERQPDGRTLWVACPHDFWLPIPNTCLSVLSVLALQVRWPS